MQIAKKRREAKGEKERNTHLNVEFQRIARRDKESLPQAAGKMADRKAGEEKPEKPQ